MSLVNDLLVDLDRRRMESNDRGAADALAGLSPARHGNTSRRSRSMIYGVVGVAFGILMIGLAYFANPSSESTSERSEFFATRASTEERASIPSVAARRAPEAEATAATGEAAESKAPTSFEPDSQERPPELAQTMKRPAALRSLAIEPGQGTTRLRIDADRTAPLRVISEASERKLEIALDDAIASAPFPLLDLRGTPIRALHARVEAGSTYVTLDLDESVHLQSQWLEQDGSATLYIDLMTSQRDPLGTPSNKPGESPSQAQRKHNVAGSESVPASTGPLLERSGRTTAPADARGNGIARSSGDQQRAHRAQADRHAQADIEIARLARDEGDIDLAIQHYASAVEIAPGHRVAVAEWTAMLAEDGRKNEALALIRAARTHAPQDPDFTMLHAQILASQGDLEASIAMLDGAQIGLAEAPQVHALAAALTQRHGDHLDAIQRYESILRRYPSEGSWWMGLGISLEAEGRETEAIDVYRIAVQIGNLPKSAHRWVATRIDALSEEG